MLTMLVHQISGHPVNVILSEAGAGRPAPDAHRLLAAVQIPLEVAEQDLHIELTSPGARHLPLPCEKEISNIKINCVFVKMLCQ